jgi:Tfp pilus assembly protein PilF
MTTKAMPGPGAALSTRTPVTTRKRRRPQDNRRILGLFNRSLYGYASASLALVALGLIWTLGGAGCGPAQTSGSLEATPGTYFDHARQSPAEVARNLRTAHYYKLMGRPDLALKELEDAHQQNPDNLRIVNALAQAYEAQGQFETARKIYREALKRNGPNRALANNLCFTYYLQGHWQEAEACFRQTLALDPGNKAARNNLGLLYCRLGRQDEARQLWQAAEGPAAAAAKIHQALAVLGIASGPIYAQAPKPAPPATKVPAPTSVAATSAPTASNVKRSTPAVPLAPQKVAKQEAPSSTPASPIPDNAKPLAEASPQPAPLKAAAVPSPAASTVKLATPAMPLAPQKVAVQVVPSSTLALPIPDNAKPLAEASPQPAPPKAAVAPAPAPTPAPQSAPRLQPPYLTCAELLGTGIELRNGTPKRHLARDVQSFLSEEAFTVISIGNYVNFGAKKTKIFYLPGAQRVARVLHANILPMAGLEQTDRLNGRAAIKILLGHDLLADQPLMARLQGDQSQLAIAVDTLVPPQKPVARLAKAKNPAPATPPPEALPPKEAAAPQPLYSPATSADTFKPMTTAELVNSPIEIQNGNGSHYLAHHTRTLLAQQGFWVTKIGNYIDFGAAHTIIYYRPEGKRVARAIRRTFFPKAELEPSLRLPEKIAIRILLGKDLLEHSQLLAYLASEER